MSRVAFGMDRVDTAAFSQDGRLVAMAPRGGPVEVWDVMSGRRVLEVEACRGIDGHSQLIESVAFSPDNQMLATASQDLTVKIWDAASRKCLSTLNIESEGYYRVAFSPGSRFIAAGKTWDHTVGDGNDDGNEPPCVVKVWDVATTACVATRKWSSPGIDRGLCFVPRIMRLACATDRALP